MDEKQSTIALIKKLEENLKKLQERDDKQYEMLRTLTENVKKLDIIITGDSSLGVAGLVKTQKEHTEFIARVNKILENIAAIKWFVFVVVLGGIGAMSTLIYFLTQISTHVIIK